VKSFVRQYAQLLELDEDELAAEAQRAMQPQTLVAHSVAQSPLSISDIRVPPVSSWDGGVAPERRFSASSSLPALALVIAVMLVCSGIYSFWQRSRHPAAAPAPEAAQTVETAKAPEPRAETPPAVQPPAQPEQAPAQAPHVSETQDQPKPPSQAPAAGSESEPQPKPQAQAPAAAPAPGLGMKIEVTAQEPVWVLAQNDGKYLFSGTLETNQTRTVEASGTVTLRLGNAGGVSITLNGKPIGPVGPRGQVRTVQFTSGGFHISAPKPPLPLDEMI